MSGSRSASTSEFAVPRLSPTFIGRPRLLRRLDEALRQPLLSLTGPAGTGKSVLAAQWCRQSGVPVAWIQLGRQTDPNQLLAMLFGALHHLTGSGPGADDDPRSNPTDRWIEGDPSIVDRIAATVEGSAPCVLVLDGIRATGPLRVYRDLAVALERAPNCGVHLLAVSRCMLPPQLNPLRLSGALPHVGASDLALDPAETAAVIEAVSRRPVSSEIAAELTDRLEGWMAGTVITALARPSGPDVSADELLDAASDGIEDFTVAEILGHLPADVVSFLYTTSAVETVTASLADHLTGRDDSDDVLRTMRRRGLPIHRVRSGLGTFRYDGWFRTVLEARHRRKGAAGPASALRSATAWFEENDRPLEAAECFARLGDWDELERMLTVHFDAFLHAVDVDRLSRLLALVPRHVRRGRIQLGLDAACVDMMAGRVSAAFEELASSRREMNPEQRVQADVIRAASVAWVDDPLLPLAAAESAMAACDELGDDHSFSLVRPSAATDLYRISARSSALMAAAYAGRWEDGRRHLVDVSPGTAGALRPVLTLRRLVARSVFLALSGEVAAATAEARAALAVASESGLLEHPFSCGAYFALGEVSRLTGDPEEGVRAIERSLEIARANRRLNLVAVATGSLAGLFVDLGQSPEALALLDHHHSIRRHRPPTTPAAMLAASEARALLAIGDQRAAMKLLHQAPQTSATAAVHVAAALGAGDVAGARNAVERWPTEKTALSRLRRGLALAMTLDTMGLTRESREELRSAFAAADHRLVQPVAEFGAPMARILRRAYRHEPDSPAGEMARRAVALVAHHGTIAPRLTAREAVVLAHLDRGLSLPAVAAETHLSVNTVKTHVKAIYRKLGASSRAEALEAWRSTLPPDRVG